MQKIFDGTDDNRTHVPCDSGAGDDSDNLAVDVGGYARKHIGFAMDDSEGRGSALLVFEEGPAPENGLPNGSPPPGFVREGILIPGQKSQLDVALAIIIAPCDETAVAGKDLVDPCFRRQRRFFDGPGEYPWMMSEKVLLLPFLYSDHGFPYFFLKRFSISASMSKVFFSEPSTFLMVCLGFSVEDPIVDIMELLNAEDAPAAKARTGSRVP